MGAKRESDRCSRRACAWLVLPVGAVALGLFPPPPLLVLPLLVPPPLMPPLPLLESGLVVGWWVLVGCTINNVRACGRQGIGGLC